MGYSLWIAMKKFRQPQVAARNAEPAVHNTQAVTNCIGNTKEMRKPNWLAPDRDLPERIEPYRCSCQGGKKKHRVGRGDPGEHANAHQQEGEIEEIQSSDRFCTISQPPADSGRTRPWKLDPRIEGC